MNRIILILLLLGISFYLYNILYKSNNHYINHPVELIDDKYIEQPIKKDRHVQFSKKNTEYIIPSREEKKINNVYDDIFIIDPIDIKNTNLTLSENEYFNN